MGFLREVVMMAAVCSVGYAWSAEGELQWWQKGGVIYQIYPRSFKDSDGDGIGDLQGITSKLGHLKELSVSALWLSPIYPSPQVDTGYDISDFVNINPEYGTLEDFDNLMKRAKELGLKVILDLVPNHTSDRHPWFIASENGDPEYADYYVWRDGKDGGPPNNWRSFFRGSAWEWSEKRQKYYLHQFAKEQPDLNYENPKVVEEMKNVMRFWLKRGLDGFRVDVPYCLFEDQRFLDEPLSGRIDDPMDPNYLNHIYTQHQPKSYDMVTQWRKLVEEFGPDKILMLEIYGTVDEAVGYYGTKEKPGGHFPFNFLAIVDVNRTSKPQDWKLVVDKWMSAMTDGRWPNWVVGNHDQHRVATRYGADLADGIVMIALTLPGTAITYYGEEIGMEDTFIPWSRTTDPPALNKGKDHYLEVSRDPQRTPMQWDDTVSAGFSKNATTWLPVNPNYWKLNVAAQPNTVIYQTKHSHLKMYKDILKARRNEIMIRGDYKTIVEGNVFIIMRTSKFSTTVFVTAVNFGDEEAEFRIKSTPVLYVYTTSMNAGNIAKGSKVNWPMKLRPKAAVLLRNFSEW